MRPAPRIATWLLRLTLPRGIVRESVVGDLSEDYASQLAAGKGKSVQLWFWRQALALCIRYGAQRLTPRISPGHREPPTGIRSILTTERRRFSAFLATVGQDLGFAARLMFKSPVYTAIAVLTLALGIGANSALFSVINSVLLEPLPFQKSESLVWLTERDLDDDEWAVSYPNFSDWRSHNDVFTDMAAHRVSNVFLTGTDRPERLSAALVSGQLFSILGVDAELGRHLAEQDDALGAPAVVVLGFDFWQRRYAGDRDIVGQKISLNETTHTVVGVMPNWFLYPLNQPDVELYVPLGYYGALSGWLDKRSTRPGLSVTARLKPGVSLRQAQTNMDAVAAGIEERYPSQNAGMSASVTPLRERLVGDMRAAFLVLAMAVALVLLIACANVANLLLSRATARAREVALRRSLGAGRSRLVRQLLTESVLLALFGGGAGILVAVWGVRLLHRVLPTNLPVTYQQIDIDGLVLGLTLLISVMTGILFGLYPAVQMTRQDLAGVLKDEGGSASPGMPRVGLRNTLAVVEISLAVVLVVCAALLMRSFLSLTTADPGFNPNNMLVSQLALPEEDFESPQELSSFYGAAEEALGALPGVESVGLAWPLLGGWQVAYVVQDRPAPGPADRHMTDFLRVSASYFTTLQVPMLRGRFFDERDDDSSTPVAIVDQVFAEKHWPGEDPIGKRVKTATDPAASEPWLEVVGLVGHVKSYGVDRFSREELYVPLNQNVYERVSFVMRLVPNSQVSAATMQGAISGLVNDRPIYSFRTMKQQLGNRWGNRRLSLVLLGAFASIALLLAVAGVYGVVSYSVSLRRREYGIRLAVGASASGIHRLVLLATVRIATTGVTLGLVAAYFATSLLSSMLFGIGTRDPVTFAGVGALLGVVAVAAGLIPASKATRVSPLAVMRSE